MVAGPGIYIKPHGDKRLQAFLSSFPGPKRRQGRWFLPHHVLPVLPDTLLEHFTVTEVVGYPRPWTEEGLRERLHASGLVRDFVLHPGFLMSFQTRALCAASDWPGFSFWHPTGAGKTLTAILRCITHWGSTLVVTRAASRVQYARKGWMWATHVEPHVLRPESQMRKSDERLADYIERVETPVVVVGWEALRAAFRCFEELGLLAWHNVVFDEVHQGKSYRRWEREPLPDLPTDVRESIAQHIRDKAKAKSLGGFVVEDKKTGERGMMLPANNRTFIASQLSRNSVWRTCTTATPVKDRVRDLYAQLDLAEPGTWGSATQWLNRYAGRKKNPWGGYDTRGASHLDELATRMQDVTHKVDSAEAQRDLPAKRRQSVYISPEDQLKAQSGWKSMLKNASRRGANAILEAKLQIAASKKRRAVLQLIEDHLHDRHKVTVFSGRRKDVDYLGKQIEKLIEKVVKQRGEAFAGAKVWAAHGGTDPTARAEIVDEYMAHEGPCVLVGTGDAFGEALDLQDTDAALFVMLPYTPGQVRQWEGRFSRLGQKRPVVIYYVIAEDTVDEHVAELLLDKFPSVSKLAPDSSMEGAQEVIAGEEDEDALMDSIFAAIGIEEDE